MAYQNISVFLRNDYSSSIVIGSLSINPNQSVLIWDTINYESGIIENFSEIINGIASFNENIGNRNLVMVLDTNDQEPQEAFDQFKELLDVYNNLDLAENGLSILRLYSKETKGLIISHNDLIDNDQNVHPQYVATDGSNSFVANLDLDGYNIINVNLVDGLDVSAHGSRHNPGGVDAVTTSTASSLTGTSTNTEGTAASLARSDHTHNISAILSSTAPVNVTKATAAAGVATAAARQDHKHDVTTAAAVTIGTANTEGSSTSLARADHVHAHGNQTSGTLHAVATGSVNGFLSSSDKTKIDAISNDTLAGGYAYFAIWAAENAAMSLNAYEWSFGANEANSVNGGLIIPFNCELYALALDHVGTSGTATVTAQRNGSAVATISTAAQVRNYTVLGSPVAFTAGQRINFQTTAVTTSSSTGNTVVAYFRTPLALTVPGVAQGDVLYYSGSAWTRLAAGSSGQFLQTQGAAANPQWATVSSTGDVVGPASATDNGIARFDGTTGKLIQNSTGITIDDSGNIVFSGAQTVDGVDVSAHGSRHNPGGTDAVSTATAVAVGTTNAEGTSTSLARADHTHQVTGLTIASQAQGDVLYYNGSNWVRLAPGTSGQFLQTQGVAANPQWGSVSGGGGGGLVELYPFSTSTDDNFDLHSTAGTYGGIIIPYANLTINGAVVYVSQTSSGNFQAAIWSIDGATRLGLSNTGDTSGSVGFKTATFSSSISLTAGTPYYVGAATNSNGTRFAATSRSGGSWNNQKPSWSVGLRVPTTISPSNNAKLLWLSFYT